MCGLQTNPLENRYSQRLMSLRKWPRGPPDRTHGNEERKFRGDQKGELILYYTEGWDDLVT